MDHVPTISIGQKYTYHRDTNRSFRDPQESEADRQDEVAGTERWLPVIWRNPEKGVQAGDPAVDERSRANGNKHYGGKAAALAGIREKYNYVSHCRRCVDPTSSGSTPEDRLKICNVDVAKAVISAKDKNIEVNGYQG